MCAEGTRSETLRAIHSWFRRDAVGTEETLRTEGNPRGQILWLDGVAGTGKTTIAQTIAYHFDKTDELDAFFFCSRDDANCSNINTIFPTIAYHLCSLHPVLQERVSEAMRKDADLQSAFVSMQLEKLIVERLEALMRNQSFRPYLVVIDALDESKEENTTSSILSALSAFPDRLDPLRFMITSWPVIHVQRGFRITGLMKDTKALILHGIPWDISQKDIRVYLERRLSQIAQSYELESWPSSDVLTHLVERSSGLFIFAVTMANFIEDQNASNPVQRLKVVLSSAYVTSTEIYPYRHLDEPYLTVLREAIPKITEHQRARLRTMLGTIVLLFDLLEAESLEALLGLDKSTVRFTLRNLHSVLSSRTWEMAPLNYFILHSTTF